jgi:hypothetical protein
MQLEDVAFWKDASNFRLFRYDDMVLTRYEGKLGAVSLYRRPSTYTVSKVFAISRKTAPVILFSVSGQSFYNARELSYSAVFGSKPKLLLASTHITESS